jgi:DNA-binding transcriptional regulator YiaG
MTPKQFNAALERLVLTQVGAAKLLGLTDRTVRNYAAGATPIPEATAKLLQLLLAKEERS